MINTGPLALFLVVGVFPHLHCSEHLYQDVVMTHMYLLDYCSNHVPDFISYSNPVYLYLS